MREEARIRRQTEIEAAAYALLEEQGYAGCTMQALARRAGASIETLYKWYGDKPGLFRALIAGNVENLQTALEATPADEGSLSGLGARLLAMLTGPRAVALNRAAAADPSGALGVALAEGGRATVMPQVAARIAALARAGRIGRDAPEAMAEVWLALLVGDMQLRRVIGALPAPTHTDCRQRAEAATARLIRLFPPAAMA